MVTSPPEVRTSSTDLAWLQTAEAQEESHAHGPAYLHGPHPELAHFAYQHRHDYGDVSGELSHSYTSNMWKEMGKEQERYGPLHSHLEHLTQTEYERREGARQETKEARIG